jgi:hypothetical protein
VSCEEEFKNEHHPSEPELPPFELPVLLFRPFEDNVISALFEELSFFF